MPLDTFDEAKFDRLIEVIENVPEEEFDINRWVPNWCGTPCCIYGHAVIAGLIVPPKEWVSKIDLFAQAFGISPKDAATITIPGEDELNAGIRRDHAVALLKQYKATRRASWKEILAVTPNTHEATEATE